MSFLSQLMQVRKQDVKKAAAEKLAAQMEREQAQEKGWRGISSVLKTVANVALPGVGGAITGALIDPLGRALGAGGSAEDMHLADRYKMYGGRESLKTAKSGFEKSISDYKKSALMGSALGFLGGEVGGKLLGKVGEAWKGSGVGKALTGIDESMTQGLMGLFESSPQVAEGLKGVSGVGLGNLYTQSKGTSMFDPSFSLLPESQYAPSTYQQGYQQGGIVEDEESYGAMPSMLYRAANPMMESSENENQWWNKLLAARPSYKQDEYERLSKHLSLRDPSEQKQSQFLTTLQGLYDSLRKSAKFENGGIIPKFATGGAVSENQGGGEVGSQKAVKGIMGYDIYEYDGVNWNKVDTIEGTGKGADKWSNIQLPEGMEITTKAALDTYRSSERTAAVGSQFMESQSDVGINDFLRTPALASLVDQARAGSPGALENIVEMLKQMRPEMANKNNTDLRNMIKDNLAKVDIYGQDYQDVVGGAQTTLEGLTGTAQTQRGQIASQAAQTGIRTGSGGFKGASTLSDQLYKQAEEEYKRMQTGITGAFEKSFGDFETMIGTIE